MIDLFFSLLPIVILVALGFAAVYTKAAPQQLIAGLGQFVLHFALPALVLSALLGQDLRETLNWNYLLVYGAGSLIAFAAVFGIARFVLHRPRPHAAIAALGGSLSNSGFVGFPVASLALGAPALTALPLSMLVENILIIPLALVLAETGAQSGRGAMTAIGHALRNMARMPLILAIVAGAALSSLGLTLPGPLFDAVSLLADAAIPCALIVVGGTLAALEVESMASDVALIAAGKLILHPLLVTLGFVWIGGVPPELVAAGIILSCAPMLTVYPIIGARFGLSQLCAAALLVTTLTSVATLAAVLTVLLGGG